MEVINHTHLRYKRSPHAVFSELDGDVALFQSNTCDYLILNETGSAIWEGLKTSPTLGELCESLLNDYEVSRDECLEDVKEWLSMAVERQVVVVCNQ